MIKTRDTFPLFGSAGNGWISCRLSDQFGLLARLPLAQVPQALQDPAIPWQGGFAAATTHPQRGLQEGTQTLRPMLMPVTTGIFLLACD